MEVQQRHGLAKAIMMDRRGEGSKKSKGKTTMSPAAYKRAAFVGLLLLIGFIVWVLSRPVYHSQKEHRMARKLVPPQAVDGNGNQVVVPHSTARHWARPRASSRRPRAKGSYSRLRRAGAADDSMPQRVGDPPALIPEEARRDLIEDVVEVPIVTRAPTPAPTEAAPTGPSPELPGIKALPHNGWGINEGKLLTWSTDGNPRALGRPGDVYSPKFAEGQLTGPQGEHVVWADGGGHSMAVTADGKAFAWGRNDSKGGGGGGSPPVNDAGQLGWPAGRGDMLRPHAVDGTGPGGYRITAVAAGRYHSVGVASDGKVYTWGLNDFGQLGRKASDDCTGGFNCRCGEIWPIDGDQPPAVGVAAGRYHSMMVAQDGGVWAWGLNLGGAPDRLPPPSAPAVGRPTAERVTGGGIEGTKVVAISAGYVHWIALTEDGEVFTCDTGFDGYANLLAQTKTSEFGREPNLESELGRSAAGDKAAKRRAYLTPGKVPKIGPAIAIAAGRCFGLAVNAQGHVYSWGCKCLGREGPTAEDRDNQAARVGGGEGGALEGKNVVAITAGEYLAAAATSDGKAFVWCTTGIEPHQSGHATAPVELKGVPDGWNIVALAAGNQHILALASRGRNRAAMTAELPTVVPVSALKKSAGAPPSPPAIRGPDPAVSDAIRAASPDVFAQLPKEWEKAYKSPCWKDASQGGKLQCLPYFSIIGVSKCGTTDLFKKLVNHPDIMESLNKGPHFWDERHDFQWYLNLFSNVAGKVPQQPKLITGDASSGTLTWSGVGIRGDPAAKYQAQGITLPMVVRAAQPDMKVIAMFRNPVDRLYSAFWYYGCLYKLYENFGMTVEGFERFAVNRVETYRKCEAEGHRDCYARLYHNIQQLVKGIYAPFLEDWLNVYDRKELLIMRMEDYSKDTKGHISQVFTHLEMEQPSEELWGSILAKRHNVRGQLTKSHQHEMCRGSTPPMSDRARHVLENFYAPFNKRLAILLGEGRWNWHWEPPAADA